MKLRLAFLVVLLLMLPLSSVPQVPTIGQRIEVRSDNPQGVPLHSNPQPSMKGRIPNGSIVTVNDLAMNGHWLKVQMADGTDGWIIEKYVVRVVAETTPSVTAPQPDDEWNVWDSAASCSAVIGTGRRMEAVDPAKLRVGTWNIRWFPDGEMNASANSAKRTDLPWLACTVAWMNVDVLALNEIRTTPEAMDAMESLRDGLRAITGADWHVDFQQCGAAQSQHVGFLWNASRVDLSNHRDVWEFNGAATSSTSSPCAGNIRPARYAFVKAKNNGADFHLFVAHLDSGTAAKDFGNRQTALNRIDQAVQSLLAQDRDVLIVGDMNTMGGPNVTAETEIADLSTLLSAEAPGFAKADVEPACSEYYQGRAGWLDHLFITQGTVEVENRKARMTGYCALASCGPIDGEMPNAYKRLSDHCPVVIEIKNQDLD